MRLYTAITCMAAALWVGSVSAPTVAARGQESRRTIWDSVFSDAQATRGQGGYTRACAKCHAADLLGTGNAPALVGEPFLGRFDRSTVDDVVQIVRQTMPQEAPDSLGAPAYVDIISYMLKMNGNPPGAAELSTDGTKLQQIVVAGRSN